MVGTAVRDCFPSSIIDTVLDYVQKSMELMTAGRVAKYQSSTGEVSPSCRQVKGMDNMQTTKKTVLWTHRTMPDSRRQWKQAMTDPGH
jgi:hypothetical protein